jgi:hypothetical protein
MNYQRIYDSIISKAKSEYRVKSNGTYYEAHHIIPVCLGGEGSSSQWKTHHNIILLTGREHFLCHWLLSRIYSKESKIQYAFWKMCIQCNNKQNRVISSSIAYEEARQRYKEEISKLHSGSIGYWTGKSRPDKTGKNHPLFGKGYRQLGDKNPMYGKAAPNRRKIQDVETNMIFDSLQEASKYYNIAESTVCLWAKKEKKLRYYKLNT